MTTASPGGHDSRGIPISLRGSSESMLSVLTSQFPPVPAVLRYARRLVPWSKRQIEECQAAFLYAVAQQYDHSGARLLEIGTAQGYSAAILAQACPRGTLLTLNPKQHEVDAARSSLAPFGKRVRVSTELSWDYLASHEASDPCDLVFVDGDHARVRLDLPWFDRVKVGGAMVFHDYAPDGTRRPCPPVFEALDAMREALGRDFDVSMIDDGLIGIVGFYRRSSDEGWRERLPEALRTF